MIIDTTHLGNSVEIVHKLFTNLIRSHPNIQRAGTRIFTFAGITIRFHGKVHKDNMMPSKGLPRDFPGVGGIRENGKGNRHRQGQKLPRNLQIISNIIDNNGNPNRLPLLVKFGQFDMVRRWKRDTLSPRHEKKEFVCQTISTIDPDRVRSEFSNPQPPVSVVQGPLKGCNHLGDFMFPVLDEKKRRCSLDAPGDRVSRKAFLKQHAKNRCGYVFSMLLTDGFPTGGLLLIVMEKGKGYNNKGNNRKNGNQDKKSGRRNLFRVSSFTRYGPPRRGNPLP